MSELDSGGALPHGPGCVVGVGDLGLSALDALTSGPLPLEIRGLFKAEFDPAPTGSWIRGVPVLGPLNVLPRYSDELRWALVALDAPIDRQVVAAALRRDGFEIVSAVHSDATISEGATLCSGAIVGPRVVVGAGARVGHSAVCGAGSILDAHVVVGDFAQVGNGALLGRRVRIGEWTEIGSGALVRDETLIGPDARVQLGAVVTRDVSAGEWFGFESRRGVPRPELDGVH